MGRILPQTIIRLLLILLLAPAMSYGDYLKIEGTTDVEDTRITTGGTGVYNYGGQGNAEQWINSTQYRFLIKTVDLAGLLPASPTMDSMKLWVYVADTEPSATGSVFRLYKPNKAGDLIGTVPVDSAFGEGLVTGNDWSAQDEEWASAGAGRAVDTCCVNTGDGTYPDRAATAQGTFDCSTTGWKSILISSALAQGIVDGDSAEYGFLLLQDQSGLVGLTSTEHSSNQPYFEVWYSVSGSQTRSGSACDNGSNWSNCGNTYASDNVRASNNTTAVDHMIDSAFAFSLPVSSTVDSFYFIVEAFGNGSTTGARAAAVQCVSNGTLVGDKVTYTLNQNNDQVDTLRGSTNDLFNTGWTVDSINNGSYGMAFFRDQASLGGDESVDHIQWVVFYTAAAGGTGQMIMIEASQ